MNYPQSVFACSHNSYEGGARGSVPHQLSIGCRLVELDIWSRDYSSARDFRIGHAWPGNSVMEGDGNPDTDHLRAWLAQLAAWRSENPSAAPLTLTLDLKDDLSRNANGQGSFADLEAELEEAFGSALYTASDWPGAWPDVDALRGRVLVVMSGNQNSRLAYYRSDLRTLFVEYQRGDSADLQPALFWACKHTHMDWAHDGVAKGRVVRVWQFDQDDTSPPPVTFPATDDPSAAWYTQYLATVGQVT